MPTFLSDPSTAFYVILGIAAFITGILALRGGDKKSWLQFGVAFALFAILFACDYFVDSPREASINALKEMAVASETKNTDGMFKYVSESFKHKSTDKAKLRDAVKRAEAELSGYKGFTVWNFSRNQFTQIDDSTIEIGFNAQLRELPQSQKSVFATFKKDSDGVWRMSGFAVYPLGQGKEGQEESIPFL